MRILHIVSTLEKGGIATSLWHLLPHLATLPDVQVEVAVLYKAGQHGRRLAQTGIPVHHIAMGHKYAPRGLWRLIQLLRQGRYEIVHAHGWPEILLAALASFVVRSPRYVLSEHNISNRRRRLGLKWLDRLIYSRYMSIVAVSQAAADALRGWLPQTAGKIEMIYNGLNIAELEAAQLTRQAARARLRVAEDVCLIFVAGSLEHRKGVDIFLEALAILPQYLDLDNHGAVQAVVAGDGPLSVLLEELIEQLELTGQVRLLGFRQDMPAIMAAADLFVLSSRWEGCPMVVLEAMALGLPLVATSVGGVPELFVDGESGLLAPPEDSPALAQAIAELFHDRSMAVRLGRAAYTRVREQFPAAFSAVRLAAVYNHLL